MNDVGADWFQRSKRLIATQDALDHETPDQQAETAALDELYGLGYDAHAKFAKQIDAVTLDQVRDLARRYLSECVIAVSTPAPAMVKVKSGARTFRSFPPLDLTPRGVQHDSAK
jgi:predicted Zn-dependent peptidase